MRKGLIMEIHKNHWILLAEDGTFMKAPKTNPYAQIGEEITIAEKVILKSTSRWKSLPVYFSLAAAAILGCFFLFPSLLSPEAQAETYVYLDVNPSIAIGLNKESHVVNVKPLNESAKKVLTGMNWKGKEADNFIVDFLVHAKNKNYVHKKDHLILSGIEQKNSEATLMSLRNVIKKDKKISKIMNLNVYTLAVPKKIQIKAQATGLSPAKYTVWLLAKESGEKISARQVEEKSITDIAHDEKKVVSILDHPPKSDSEWEKIISKDSGKQPDGTSKSPGSASESGGIKPANSPAPSSKPVSTRTEDPTPASQQTEQPKKEPTTSPAVTTNPDPNGTKKSGTGDGTNNNNPK